MPHTGLVLICSHVDIEDRFYREITFLIFETASAFHDSFTHGLNNTATPPLGTYIGAIIQAGKCAKDCMKSMPSLLFCAIVAVVEVETGRQHAPKVDFREFQEFEARNEGSRANPHTWRRDTEVGMVGAHHLGVVWAHHVTAWGKL